MSSESNDFTPTTPLNQTAMKAVGDSATAPGRIPDTTKHSTASFLFEMGEQTREIEIPRQIAGRYTLGNILGEGGFGTVYKAFDETLHRSVAIKIPRQLLTEEEQRNAFLSEARQAAGIEHRGIVIVYDFGIEKAGFCYVVYEFLPGQSLKDIFQQQALTDQRVLEIMIGVAEALVVAHKQGVIHRDLKPANILLDANGLPRICDFGLAVNGTSQRKFRGDVSGTLAYMAPEQLRGQVHFFDGRTDIWALGAILYEYFAGRKPFQGNSTKDIAEEILQRDVRPPRQLNERIPRRLEACILKCLAKPVADRYASALDIAEELRAVVVEIELASSPRAIAPVHVAVPVKRQNLILTVLASITVLCLTLTTLVVLYKVLNGTGTPPEEPEIATPVQPLVAPVSPWVEDGLEPYQWLDLLKRTPKPIQWPAQGTETSSWNMIEEPRGLFASTPYGGMFEMGRTKAHNFTITTKLQQTPWTGGAGIYFGYGDDPNDPNKIVFQSIEIYRIDPTAFPVKWGLLRCKVEIQKVKKTVPSSATTLVSTAVPPPTSECMLRLEFLHNKLEKVLWNGKEVLELTQSPMLEQITIPSARGGFGSILSNSSTIFRKPLFQYFELGDDAS